MVRPWVNVDAQGWGEGVTGRAEDFLAPGKPNA